jgi:hypothetical protein
MRYSCAIHLVSLTPIQAVGKKRPVLHLSYCFYESIPIQPLSVVVRALTTVWRTIYLLDIKGLSLTLDEVCRVEIESVFQ